MSRILFATYSFHGKKQDGLWADKMITIAIIVC